jgi:hypothetical protein
VTGPAIGAAVMLGVLVTGAGAALMLLAGRHLPRPPRRQG